MAEYYECDNCKGKFDKHSVVAPGNPEAVPRKGDMTICARCAAWLELGDLPETKVMSDDEVLEHVDLATKTAVELAVVNMIAERTMDA